VSIAHAAPTLDETFGSPGERTPEPTTQPGKDTLTRVVIAHDVFDPLVLAPGAAPPEGALYTDTTRSAVTIPGASPVTRVFGSVEAPEEVPCLDPTTMFIAGVPTIDDVKQGRIGDCWLLAAVVDIVAQDPGRITSMMSFSGAEASATFHHYEPNAGTWVPVVVSTPNTLLRSQDAARPADPGQLVVGGLRRADDPSSSAWSADLRNTDLHVLRSDRYQAALWAPLLEKLYATFAEQFGQYGGAPSTLHHENNRSDPQMSGYKALDGGCDFAVYPVFYGEDARDDRQTRIAYAAGANPVLANQTAIDHLLRVGGEGVAQGEEFLLSVGLAPDTAVKRLKALTQRILGERDSRDHPSLRAEIAYLASLCDAYDATTEDTPARDHALERLARAAASDADPASWPLISSASAPALYRELYEKLNTVKALGTDHSRGQRNVYAYHAYSVLGASFARADGSPLVLTSANLAAELANVDPEASHVRLRNPHHGNEPNLPTTAQDAAPDDGVFTLTLGQYLRDFGHENLATVDKAGP
jgi:hypothetical protein